MREKILLITTVVLFGFGLAVVAQQRRTPAPPVSRVDGTVVDGNNRPIAAASVTVFQDADNRSVNTDSQGHFSIAVAHGTVRLVTRKQGYVHRTDGTLITVAPGQQVRGLLLHLDAAATLTGSVLDSKRKPVQYAHALLMRYTYNDDGVRALRQAGSAAGGITNDHGEFRIESIEPSEYLLQIDPPLFAEREPGEPFVRFYYPDTQDPLHAQSVALKSGSDMHLDDLTLPSVRGGAIRLHLINQTGERMENTFAKYVRWSGKGLGLEPISAVLPLLIMGGPERAEIPVPPGTYDVTAGWLRSSKDGAMPVGFGHKTVEIGRTNVDLDIPTTKGVTVNGHVMQEQIKGETKPASGVLCELTNNIWMTLSGTTDRNGSTSINNVQAGLYRLNCSALPPNTYILSMRQGERDLLREEFRVDGGDDSNFIVTLGASGGIVEGFVTDAKNREPANAVVTLVPDSPLRGVKNLYRTVTSDQFGGFSIRAVAPGTYQVYAWRSVEANAYKNDDFMKKYEAKGTRVQVERSAKVAITTRLLDIAERN